MPPFLGRPYPEADIADVSAMSKKMAPRLEPSVSKSELIDLEITPPLVAFFCAPLSQSSSTLGWPWKGRAPQVEIFGISRMSTHWGSRHWGMAVKPTSPAVPFPASLLLDSKLVTPPRSRANRSP